MRAESQKINFPGFEAVEGMRVDDGTANGLTRCVLNLLRLKNHHGERINTTGISTQTKDGIRWRATNNTIGSADIHALINGRAVYIEVKIGRDTQSEAQKEYQKSVEDSGGLYWIIKNFNQFESKYKELTGEQ